MYSVNWGYKCLTKFKRECYFHGVNNLYRQTSNTLLTILSLEVNHTFETVMDLTKNKEFHVCNAFIHVQIQRNILPFQTMIFEKRVFCLNLQWRNCIIFFIIRGQKMIHFLMFWKIKSWMWYSLWQHYQYLTPYDLSKDMYLIRIIQLQNFIDKKILQPCNSNEG